MKTIKLNDTTYTIVEREEINYKRSVAFQDYLNIILEGLTDLKLTIIFDKIKKTFNSGNYYEIPIICDNFQQSFKLKEVGFDAWGYCFALICSEKDEDLSITDQNFLKEKLNRMTANGLTFNTVEKEVENFTKAFPLSWLIYQMRKEGLKLQN